MKGKFLYQKGPDQRASATKWWFSLFMAVALVFGFGVAARVLFLDAGNFVQALPYAAGYLAGLTATATAVYHLGKKNGGGT